MCHREIIPTDHQQTGQPHRRVAAQINLRQGHWGQDCVTVVASTMLRPAATTLRLPRNIDFSPDKTISGRNETVLDSYGACLADSCEQWLNL
jgi:hypothetical protein